LAIETMSPSLEIRSGKSDSIPKSALTSAIDRPDYVMIVGHGRSGTNWLLQLLNLSPETHCRNEPDEIKGSPLALLPCPWTKRERQPELDLNWGEAVQWAATRFGERDPRLPARKDHILELARRLRITRLAERPKLRSFASTFIASLRGHEWAGPAWVDRDILLKRALPVLKFVQVPGWAAWVLANRPRVAVLHIVRHPEGFLNSWRRRYLSARDPEAVSRANQQRLWQVAECDGAWRDRFGPVDQMTMDESELAYWWYACETIHRAGLENPRYRLIIYEGLAHDPIRTAQSLFQMCGLSWSRRIELDIVRTSATSKEIAGAWRQNRTRESEALVAKVLRESLMREWWT
jgi:hypothetical protein